MRSIHEADKGLGFVNSKGLNWTHTWCLDQCVYEFGYFLSQFVGGEINAATVAAAVLFLCHFCFRNVGGKVFQTNNVGANFLSSLTCTFALKVKRIEYLHLPQLRMVFGVCKFSFFPRFSKSFCWFSYYR